ncbi:MAG: DUF2079 domain-containing protein [Lachnospiraceae bacterium]|nr:DUF2079 domain-containing protein [Lachnospiraceae bacterium]
MNILKNIKELFLYALTEAKERGFGLDTMIAFAAVGFFVAWSCTAQYITFGSNSYFTEMKIQTFVLYCVLTWAFLVLAILAVRDAQVVYVCLGVTSMFLAAVYGLYMGNNLWPLLGVDFVLLLVFQYIWSKQKDMRRRLRKASEGKHRAAEVNHATEVDRAAEANRVAEENCVAEKKNRGKRKKFRMSRGEAVSFAAVTVVFFIFFIAIGWYASLRYKMYLSPTFDFGIFAQLFEQMAKTGLPYTTLERSAYFSHYGVHFSPALYLLLPGYLLFRSPEYLIYAQAFCVGLGAFPVWLICREFHFSPKTCFLGAMLYLLMPSVGFGCFKDFHENKLLAVLILWLIYFYVKKKYVGMAVFSLLTMMVKEDAAIYTASIGLWMFFYAKSGTGIKKTEIADAGGTESIIADSGTAGSEVKESVQSVDLNGESQKSTGKSIITEGVWGSGKSEKPAKRKWNREKFRAWFTENRVGMILFIVSLIYFFVACAIVDSYGEGTMTVRYGDYIFDEESTFLDVIKICVTYFGYMLQNVFQEAKMEYVLWMLAPVAFLPFRNKKISIWLLFVPMLLINILSDWVYQYDIAYQYTYGVAALTLTAALFTIRNWNRAKAEFAILTCAVLCVPLFMGTTVSKAIYYNQYWDEELQEECALTTEALEVIPQGASVTATSNITAHLYYVDELYTMPDYYGSLQQTDYYVINYATDYSEYDESPWDIVAEGYELVIKQGKVAIYQRID